MSEHTIFPSGKHDPGLRDLFGCAAQERDRQGGEKMRNVIVHSNDKGIVTSAYPDTYPCADTLFEISAYYKIEERKRNYVLVIEDMENGYGKYINHCIPQVKALINLFRKLKLPIVWTNWSRQPGDGHDGALDRYYGPQGIKDEMNPCYTYGENCTGTVDELAPITDDEKSCSIASLHLSKFADLDENGREILFPMLEAWGVNTIVLTGAWTDDCMTATGFDATDKYGYDVILVTDAVATATINGDIGSDVLGGSCTLNMTSEQVCEHIAKHPELLEAPKAALNGSVRHTMTQYRIDPLMDEVAQLKKKVAELEAKLASKK